MKVAALETKVTKVTTFRPGSFHFVYPELNDKAPVTKLQLIEGMYNWSIWFFLVFLVVSQALGIFWDTTMIKYDIIYVEDPRKGTSAIEGFNDEPYSDRLFVCVLQGNAYVPLTVNEVLSLGTTKLIDLTGTLVDGYRVVSRDTTTVGSEAAVSYTHMCAQIAETIGHIYQTCNTLGYNVTQDNLRIVNDLDSSKMYLIKQSLPVLIWT